MSPYFKKFKIKQCDGLAIYKYEGVIKEMIYRYKGCYDYELKNAFLSMYLKELRAIYKGYFLIPAPSYIENDIERGFNHVYEIGKQLNLEILSVLGKHENISLHTLGFEERTEASKTLYIKNKIDLSNKKILLFDDICTTGTTLSTCIDLLKTLHPKIIKVLVVAKREFTKEERKKLSKDYKVLE